MASLAKLCAGLTDQAIIDAAERFSAGDVQDQSPKFAPSAPEFVAEARRRQEILDIYARPRITPPPVCRPGPLAPFEIKRQKALAENANRPVILEDASLDVFRKMSKAGELPAGSKWIAVLATIYGPERDVKSEAA